MSTETLLPRWARDQRAARPPITVNAIRPVPGKILVKKLKREEKTSGGIYLVEETRDLSQTGEVLVIGEGVSLVRPGDVVLYSRYAATPFVGTDEDLVFVRELDLFAVVEQGAADSGQSAGAGHLGIEDGADDD